MYTVLDSDTIIPTSNNNMLCTKMWYISHAQGHNASSQTHLGDPTNLIGNVVLGLSVANKFIICNVESLLPEALLI